MQLRKKPFTSCLTIGLSDLISVNSVNSVSSLQRGASSISDGILLTSSSFSVAWSSICGWQAPSLPSFDHFCPRRNLPMCQFITPMIHIITISMTFFLFFALLDAADLNCGPLAVLAKGWSDMRAERFTIKIWKSNGSRRLVCFQLMMSTGSSVRSWCKRIDLESAAVKMV